MIVTLEGGGETQQFQVIKPAEPGLFRPVAIPAAAGQRRVKVTIETDEWRDVHDLGTFEVYASAEAAEGAGGAGQEGSIALLKEQQWTMGFSTAPVTRDEIRPSLRVYGTVQASQGQELELGAPTSGQVVELVEGLGRGIAVGQGQVLARLAPLPQSGLDVPALGAALREARATVQFTRSERERLEGLLVKGAVSQRRLDEAVLAQQLAQVKLTEAGQRLAMARRSAGARGQSIEVRAPSRGVIVAVDVAPGQAVEQGAVLFRMVDSGSLWVEARIPEFDLGKVAAPFRGWVEVPGGERVDLRSEQVVGSVGPVDRLTRTAPLRFVVDEGAKGLYLGASVMVHLNTGAAEKGHTIPVGAILREGGQDVVFVQRSGESFDRRPVRLGASGKERVVVLEGLSDNERVVDRGAYLVKLASSSNQVPDHGHAH